MKRAPLIIATICIVISAFTAFFGVAAQTRGNIIFAIAAAAVAVVVVRFLYNTIANHKKWPRYSLAHLIDDIITTVIWP